MSGAFRPVEVPDLGATLSRMAQIDAQRQALDIQRQAAKQDAGFNATLGELGPALAAGQGPEYSAALGRLFAAGPRGATMALPMLQAERHRAEAEAFWRQPQGGAPVATGGPVAPRPAGEPPPEIQAAIAEASRETGIPIPILTAQLRQESNWDPNARGRSGEIGVAQIMPATARAPGYGVQPVDPATLSDPRTNILFGARYLAGRGRAAGVTDWNDPAQVDRALAAYNGGGDPNYVRNVRQWLPQDGGQPSATPAAAPAQAGGVNPAEMALIERALAHPNPQVQQQGRARLEVLRMRQQNNPEQYVTVTETIGGRQVQGQRNTRTGQFTPFPGQTGGTPTETQQDRARYIDLAQRRATLTPAEAAELGLIELRLSDRPQVAVGPSGIAVVPARPLPLGAGEAQIAAPDGMPIGQPPAQSGLAQPVNDAVPGAAPSPTQRPPQAVNLPDGRTAQFIPAEQPQAPPPQGVATAMLENANGLRQARLALERATARPESFGFWRGVQNQVPGAIDRIDPDGVEARALAANLGSMRIHDRSGTAVTAAEFPRLRPFIPAVGDAPETVQRKLREFVREYEAVLRDQYQAFGPASGYRALAPVESLLGGAQGGQDTPQQRQPQVIQYDAQGRRMR